MRLSKFCLPLASILDCRIGQLQQFPRVNATTVICPDLRPIPMRGCTSGTYSVGEEVVIVRHPDGTVSAVYFVSHSAYAFTSIIGTVPLNCSIEINLNRNAVAGFPSRVNSYLPCEGSHTKCPCAAKRSSIVTEEVVGLGRYGKTLTVLSSRKIGHEANTDEGNDEEDLVERWTPRFRK